MTSNYIKHKKAAMTWTMYVMEAVGRAKRTGIPVTLHVGKETSAMVLQEALLSLHLVEKMPLGMFTYKHIRYTNETITTRY